MLSSIRCSPALTRSAWKPKNPPSFAASAAACATATSQVANASASSGVAFSATIPWAALSSARISTPALAGARGLEAGQRVLALARVCGRVLSDRLDDLAAAAVLGGEHGLERGGRLLERLDRPARVGQRDRHARDERGTHQAGPLLIGECVLRCHANELSTLRRSPAVIYPVEAFTAAERERLRPHFTNLDQPVFAIVGLPETTKAALFARYSRYPGTLRRLFLDEFVDAAGAPLRPRARGRRRCSTACSSATATTRSRSSAVRTSPASTSRTS